MGVSMQRALDRSVAGRRVVVTAGASGIGLAIARAFHAEGAQVWVADVSPEMLARLQRETPGIRAATCDVGEPEQVSALFTQVCEQWGALDALINNAGIAGPTAAIEAIAWADWDRTLRVNVGGMFLCIQAALPLMRSAGRGAIVNISSSSARTGLIGRLPYVASKAAVHGLTLNVARETGPHNISCNALLPGMLDNERGHGLIAADAARLGISYDAALQANLQYISMRSVIDPGEVAAMCLHLASDAGAHISAQLIGVCGNAEWE